MTHLPEWVVLVTIAILVASWAVVFAGLWRVGMWVIKRWVRPTCPHDPRETHGPIGMYHCPDCGCMVLAGLDHGPHEDWCSYWPKCDDTMAGWAGKE